jgi:hypothetical protein
LVEKKGESMSSDAQADSYEAFCSTKTSENWMLGAMKRGSHLQMVYDPAIWEGSAAKIGAVTMRLFIEHEQPNTDLIRLCV